MKILIACEFSGIVRDAFIAKGHDAVSCDLLPTERPGPHIQGDVLDIMDDGWDMMIAHPPCTYLSRAGARWLYSGGQLNTKRYNQGIVAKKFFLSLLDAPLDKIAIENPTPFKIFALPRHTQVIQPYEHGHAFSKRTLLWLRNLPPLTPTNITDNFVPYLPSNTGGKKRGQRYRYANISQKQANRTFQGIANAMAEQWG